MEKIKEKLEENIMGELKTRFDGYEQRVHELVLSLAIIVDRIRADNQKGFPR